MNSAIGLREWCKAFGKEVRHARWTVPLRDAALKGRLKEGTQHLTGAVVVIGHALGWRAVARGYSAKGLPVAKQQCLGIEVRALPASKSHGWQRPVAAFELENRQEEAMVAYALWKVNLLCYPLAGVFCYCRDPEGIGDLLNALKSRGMGELERTFSAEEHFTFVVGTRSRGEDFPDGF